MLCQPVSLFCKEKRPHVFSTGSTLYIIGYCNITGGLLNWIISIQIEFAMPRVRSWLNHFNNWLYLNIKRTAEIRLFDFSKTLCWNTHFPTFLLSSKQNVNTNLQQGGFFILYYQSLSLERNLHAPILQNIKFVCFPLSRLSMMKSCARMELAVTFSAEFLSRFKCRTSLSSPLRYFRYPAQLTAV